MPDLNSNSPYPALIYCCSYYTHESPSREGPQEGPRRIRVLGSARRMHRRIDRNGHRPRTPGFKGLYLHKSRDGRSGGV
jgi:hypothetical protein